MRRDDVTGTQLILKALHSHGGGFFSGLRERYFGDLLQAQSQGPSARSRGLHLPWGSTCLPLLQGLPRVARFLDACSFREG